MHAVDNTPRVTIVNLILGLQEACDVCHRGLLQGWLQALQHCDKPACIEEVAQLVCEHPELMHKVSRVASVRCCDALQHGLSGYKVFRASVAVELVLKRVLDFALEVGGDVVAVCDVPDSRQRH